MNIWLFNCDHGADVTPFGCCQSTHDFQFRHVNIIAPNSTIPSRTPCQFPKFSSHDVSFLSYLRIPSERKSHWKIERHHEWNVLPGGLLSERFHIHTFFVQNSAQYNAELTDDSHGLHLESGSSWSYLIRMGFMGLSLNTLSSCHIVTHSQEIMTVHKEVSEDTCSLITTKKPARSASELGVYCCEEQARFQWQVMLGSNVTLPWPRAEMPGVMYTRSIRGCRK